MYLPGEWYECDDGVIRPVIRGRIRRADRSWLVAEFLVDVGADRTVFTEPVFRQLRLGPHGSQDGLSGLGGIVTAVQVKTAILLNDLDGRDISFPGEYAALTDPEALDMCVLGRDLTNAFTVIIDRPGNRVCLINQRHQYVIETV